MAIRIDDIELGIKQDSTEAVNSIEKFEGALKKLKTTLGSFAGDRVSKGISSVEKSLSKLAAVSISDSQIQKYERLTAALEKLSKVKTVKIPKVKDNGNNITDDASAAGRLRFAWLDWLKERLTVIKGAANDAATSTDKIGKNAEKSGKSGISAFTKLFASIKRIAMYRLIRSAFAAIGKSIKEGTENLYQWSKLQKDTTGNKFAQSMDKAASAMLYLKNGIGAAVTPIIESLIPVLEKAINKLVDFFNRVSELAAIIKGENAYVKARYLDIEYGAEDATKANEKLKKSLLGFDEINALSDNSSDKSADASKNYADMFETVKLESGASIESYIKDHAPSIALEGAIALAAGLVLAFSGANIPLGIALIAIGAAAEIAVLKENPEAIKKLISDHAPAIALGGMTALVVGMILAFTGVNIPLGIALMATGAAATVEAVAINWDSIKTALQGPIGAVTAVVSGALLAVGAILAFSGANIPLGIGLIAAGALALGTAAVVNWDSIKTALKGPVGAVTAVVSGALLAVGAILAFSGVNIPLGIALIAAGAGGLATTATLNWESIKEKLSTKFSEVRESFDEKLQPVIDFFKGKWENFSGGVKSIAISASATLSKLWTSVVNFWNKLTGKDTKNVEVDADGETTSLFDKISAFWNKITGKDAKTEKTVTTKATGTTDNLFTSISNFWNKIFGKNGDKKTVTANLKGTEDDKGGKLRSFWGGLKSGTTKSAKVGLSWTEKSSSIRTWFSNRTKGTSAPVTAKWKDKAADNPVRTWFAAKAKGITASVKAKWNEKDNTTTETRFELAEWVSGITTKVQAKWKDSKAKAWFDGLLDATAQLKIELTDKVTKAIQSALTKIRDAINKAIEVINKLPGVEIEKLGKFNFETYATGGFPSYGSMFIAGEAGTELVGTINGRTGVASQGEITGIADAVRESSDREARLLTALIGAVENNGNGEVVISTSALTNALARNNRRMGRTVSAVGT